MMKMLKKKAQKTAMKLCRLPVKGDSGTCTLSFANAQTHKSGWYTTMVRREMILQIDHEVGSTTI